MRSFHCRRRSFSGNCCQDSSASCCACEDVTVWPDLPPHTMSSATPFALKTRVCSFSYVIQHDKIQEQKTSPQNPTVRQLKKTNYIIREIITKQLTCSSQQAQNVWLSGEADCQQIQLVKVKTFLLVADTVLLIRAASFCSQKPVTFCVMIPFCSTEK